MKYYSNPTKLEYFLIWFDLSKKRKHCRSGTINKCHFGKQFHSNHTLIYFIFTSLLT